MKQGEPGGGAAHLCSVGLLRLSLLQSLQVSAPLVFGDNQGELKGHQEGELSAQDLLGGYLHHIHNVLQRKSG